MSDADLLRRYLQDESAEAFATLVQRHLDLVYSVARRKTGSATLAGDVAQSVFIELARNARRINPRTPLVAWLHVVTRRTAINTLRDEARRRAREQQAAEIAACHESAGPAMKSNDSDWQAVEPLLDDAVDSLDEPDRTAILLRFFQNKPLREVGAALGTSDDAAQKRVTRALDQLRAFFLRRSVTVTTAGLATDLSAHALQTAPAGLGVSIASATAVNAISHTLASHAAILTMTTLEKTLLTAGLVLALGGAVFEASTLRAERAEFSALRQRVDMLSTTARQTRQERDVALRQTDAANQRLAALAAVAKSPADLAMETEMNAWLDRATRLKQLRDQRPDLVIPELLLLSDENWFQEARAPLTNEDQIRDAFAHLRNRAESAFNAKLRLALHAYLDAHDGMLPESSRELAEFFAPPIDPSTLDRYKMIAAGKIADLRPGLSLIEQHTPLDFSRDTAWDISLTGGGYQPALNLYVHQAVKAFTEAHPGVQPTQAQQLQPYLPSPVDSDKLQRYLNPPRR